MRAWVSPFVSSLRPTPLPPLSIVPSLFPPYTVVSHPHSHIPHSPLPYLLELKYHGWAPGYNHRPPVLLLKDCPSTLLKRLALLRLCVLFLWPGACWLE